MSTINEDAKDLETQLQAAEERCRELERLVEHDPQTGLPIRRRFERRLEGLLQETEGKHRRVAIAVLRLDRDYDRIRNSRDRSRALLFKTAVRIRNVIGENIYQSDRFDEFLLVMPATGDGDALRIVASRILEEISRPHEPPAQDIIFGCYLGLATQLRRNMSRHDLVENAFVALEEAETTGRSFVLYDDDLGIRFRERERITQYLRSSIQEGFPGFRMVYQPFVDAESRISGGEALVRWHHERMGHIAPGRFIPLAEQSGDIRFVGQWTLYNACRDLKGWHQAGRRDVYVSVNLSPAQFKQPDVVERIFSMVEATGIESEALRLEITEGAAMQNPDESIRKLQSLRDGGIRISIDDFGTGYSSLGYLKQFPIDTLKIDRSFVADVVKNRGNQAIIRAVVSMAQNLGIETLAEGAETADEVAFLFEAGCDKIQGYYFSPPVDSIQFQRYLTKQEPLAGPGILKG
ncbi:MAG: putative bifunctional diguanylate cyclase/phosphodiesterase [Spirochaetota bacterium]